MTDGTDAPAESFPDDTEIRPLDEATVAKIAAGEVVERPASVVKELVENALDAGAARIRVAVQNGGIDRIDVRDDGAGMTEADVRAAVREHTTSKLSDADDLERVQTLGFRGEALHTIGAVSRMEITTKPDDAGAGSDASGTRLHYAGGDVESVEPAAHPGGTTVEVSDLFYNTPARRKYLGEPATEFRHVSRVVGRYALANPDVAVALEHDGSEIYATTGEGDRLAAVMAVYGREVAESMVHVDVAPDTDAVDRIYGHVSHPETTRASREYLATYVDDRYVEVDALRAPIVDAYGGQLAADRYPFAVLFVEVPAGQVDVNVHPRKLAVRFDDEAAVRDAVETAVREALLEEGLARSSAPRGVSAPEEATVAPERSGSGDEAVAGADDPSAGERPGDGSPDGSTGGASSSPSASDADSEPTPSPAEGGSASDGPPTASGAGGDQPEGTASADSGAATPEPGSDPAAPADDPTTTPTAPADADRRFDATDQRTLDGDAAEVAGEFDALPPLRVLGQLRDTYVVAEGPEGLLLVDQHAADERVHYERLQAAVEDGAAQALAEPVELSLTPTEAETYDDCAPAIERLGFHADRDGRTLEVRSVPTILGETLAPDAVRDVFEALLRADGGDGSGTVEGMADDLLADLACAPAVTGNTSLTAGSVASLLEALDACENPFECPHGRPTVVRIDADELEGRFERDYPGHDQRRE